MHYHVTPEIIKAIQEFMIEVPPYQFSTELRTTLLTHFQDSQYGTPNNNTFTTGLYHLFNVLDAIVKSRAQVHGLLGQHF